MRLCVVPFLLVIALGVTTYGAETEIDARQRLLQSELNQEGLGEDVSGLTFKDTAGHEYRAGESGHLAFVFLSKSCPLAKRYTQRLNRLHEEFSREVSSKAGITVLGVFSNAEDDRTDVVEHAQAMKIAFPVVKDWNGYVAKHLGAQMTPQAIVVDAAGVIRYRGSIDDNRYENRVKKRYMQDALVALTGDKEITTKVTKCLGCTIHLNEPSEIVAVTYTQHIARVLQDNCQTCHRDGQVAPFALTNYEEAKTWAAEINAYSQARLMPPWKAEPNFGEFQHDKRMSEDELKLLDRWCTEKTPLGPESAMPPTPKYPDVWALGEPDHIVQMPEEYTIGPEGEDIYRHFIVPTDFDKPMFVEATDVIPGNRLTVHHVIAYVDNSGKARKLDAADPGPGYSRFGDVGFDPVSVLGGWVPGTEPTRTPEGTGFWLPAGADVVLQVHYYRTGVEEKDRTKVGLYFSKHPKPATIRMGIAINTKFEIPAGAARHPVNARWRIKESVYAISVTPHMHLIGKDMKVAAKLPNGDSNPLVWIKDWDFNWQLSYHFLKPMLLPEGTVVQMNSHFDNSSDNPNNPNSPPKPVRWGEKTTDEMSIAFVAYLNASEWQPPKVE